MGLEHNLFWGRLAVSFVRSLGIRANNNFTDGMSDRERQELWRCIQTAPDSVREQFRASCFGRDTDCLPEMATLVRQKQCGNCFEQDAVAIMFLMRAHVRPLDLMNLYPHNSIDHVFIVIGRWPNRTDPDWVPFPQSRAYGSIDSDPSTWGPDAVVCDPWHDGGKVYSASEIRTRMFDNYGSFRGTFQPTSIWRMD